MNIKSLRAVAGVALLGLFASGASHADTKAEIRHSADRALTHFYHLNPANRALVGNAAGVLIFGHVTKAGFGDRAIQLSIFRSSSMSEVTSITSGSLIAAEKVNGTNVYNLAGENLGTIDDIMIDKVSGHAIYAVMSFGGCLGMGKKHNPLPWGTLKYDDKKSGYVINMDKKQLQDSPNYDIGSDFKWTPEYGRKVDSYYKVQSYWK